MQAVFGTECKSHHLRAPYFVNGTGACDFDLETLSFAGTPVQQAMCLMRGMDASRNLSPPLDNLPPGLALRIGESTGLPSRAALASYLSKQPRLASLTIEMRNGVGISVPMMSAANGWSGFRMLI
jgi:hypothetical protein